MIIDNYISKKLDTYNDYTLLGKPDAQITYDNQFLPSKKVSLQGYREFATYAGALTYVTTHVSAFPGIIVTVSNDDTADKNGAYLVSNDEVDTVSNPNGLKLIKLTAAETGPGNLGWGEITTGGIVIPDINDLEIEAAPFIPIE